MEVSAPFVKKHLDGGIYVAHSIAIGDWEEWGWLYEWVANSKCFDFRWETVDGLCGWFEEHLNYWDWNNTHKGKINQLDLLIPIKPKEKNNVN